MRRAFVLLAVVPLVAAAATAPIREVTSQAIETGGMLIPAFFKGYIYWAGRSNPLTIYGPDGFLTAYKETTNGTAQAIAADTDGTLAIAWHTKAADGIDLENAAGKVVRTIPTGRYRPTHLFFAADHTLWSLGWQTAPGNPQMVDASDYPIVRKFLPNGQEAGAYLPRSRFPRGIEPGQTSWQDSNCITISQSGAGLQVVSGMDSAKTEWVELDLNGNLTGRWSLDRFHNDMSVAMTSDGHAFLQYWDKDAKARVLLTLDRESSTWRRVQAAPEGYMVSADGDSLIFADRGRGPIRLRWYQHP